MIKIEEWQCGQVGFLFGQEQMSICHIEQAILKQEKIISIFLEVNVDQIAVHSFIYFNILSDCLFYSLWQCFLKEVITATFFSYRNKILQSSIVYTPVYLLYQQFFCIVCLNVQESQNIKCGTVIHISISSVNQSADQHYSYYKPVELFFLFSGLF